MDDAEDLLLRGLRSAVAANPDSLDLRVHVAAVLLDRGYAAEALEQCSAVLAHDPDHPEALGLLERATGALTGIIARGPDEFRWSGQQESRIVDQVLAAPEEDAAFIQDDVVVAPEVRLTDVAGMQEVKHRIEVAFLGPVRHPDLARQYGRSATGGLLLYGAPGCGKTFLARAMAGELGARFYPVTLAHVLDAYAGRAEFSVRQIFQTARRNAPCVVFLDEFDALGMRRSQLTHTALRGMTNQLLQEMDSVRERNDGVFVLAATNHPWDIDPALRRPGRFDRMMLVLPPDPQARAAILRYHLTDRPLGPIDIDTLVARTDGFSGADLAHLCDTAAGGAMEQAMRTGATRPIQMPDFYAALAEVTSSTCAWLVEARSVAMFANADGSYDDLLAYLKSRRLA